MMRSRRRVAAVLATVAVLGVGQAGCSGDTEDGTYPSGQLEFVVPYNPGGSADPSGREFARLLGQELGTDAVVENQPGGDETIGVSSVLQSDPDGMTVGLTSATGIIVQPLINDQLSYDGPADVAVPTKMLEAPNALVVAESSPYASLEDLVEDARARPGEVRIGTTGRISNNSFALAQLERQSGVEITIVPFPGGAGEAVLAALSGEVEAAIPTAAGQIGLLDAGELRALAHTGSPEYDEVVGVSSFDDQGYDMPYVSADYFVIAPVGMPDEVEASLTEAAQAVAASDDWADFCASNGFLADPMASAEIETWIENSLEATEEGIDLMEGRE